MKEEFLGLTIVQEDTIKCGDCGSVLANVVVSETNENRRSRLLKPLNSKYQVKGCYKCNGSSFVTNIFSGSTSICPGKDFFDLDVVDTEVDDQGNIFSILEVRKRNK